MATYRGIKYKVEFDDDGECPSWEVFVDGKWLTSSLSNESGVESAKEEIDNMLNE